MTINAMDGHSSVAIAANSSCSDLLMRLVDSDPDFLFLFNLHPARFGPGSRQAFFVTNSTINGPIKDCIDVNACLHSKP